MARGKYSERAYKHWPENYKYKYNCYGEIPEEWHGPDSGKEYNEKTMFGDYDEEGYDSYGYSAFDIYGNYVGDGRGVDRAGWTEDDYLCERDLEQEEDDL